MDLDWHDVAAQDAVWEGAGLPVQAADVALALFRVGDAVHALAAMCTHGHAQLCDGFVEGGEVECPLHQARFDIASGAVRCGPATQPVAVYPVRLVDGRVQVGVQA